VCPGCHSGDKVIDIGETDPYEGGAQINWLSPPSSFSGANSSGSMNLGKLVSWERRNEVKGRGLWEINISGSKKLLQIFYFV
jgi:hypothetical protein